MSGALSIDVRDSVQHGAPRRLAERVRVADTFTTRLRGLLGSSHGEDEGLLIVPCASVHTFGMSYPIDIVYLDKDSRALALYHNLKPWRATRRVLGAYGVLELTAGALKKHDLRVGQIVEVPPMEEQPAGKSLLANLVLGAFWLFLALFMLPKLVSGEAGPSGYMLFAVNTLVAVLFLTRRKETRVTESTRDRLVTTVCILMSFSLRPAAGASLISGLWESVLLTISLVLIFAAYLSLGRSFGLIPADRGVKVKGMYQWVRHPLYGAEMLFFISFVLANFTARNVVFTLGIFLSLHMRALAEERLLSHDSLYQDFCQRIGKRYIPYVI
ncbi:MAG: hypothetical protein HOG04_00135 [Nitrospinaceae bacterium]|nr:hypothetical protein [Nitrospinaceae bacterium]